MAAVIPNIREQRLGGDKRVMVAFLVGSGSDRLRAMECALVVVVHFQGAPLDRFSPVAQVGTLVDGLSPLSVGSLP